MMEWNDIGIKDADDVIRCIKEGASASELLALYGDRIAPLLAEAFGKNEGNAALGRSVPSTPLADTFEALAIARDAEAKACWNMDGESYRGEAEAYREAARMVRGAAPVIVSEKAAELAELLAHLPDETMETMARNFRAARDAALGRSVPSTPLEERITRAWEKAKNEAEAHPNRERAVYCDGTAHGLKEALRMVREQGPTVPRAAVEALRSALEEAIDGWEATLPYKLDYLVEKHGDKEDITRLRALLAPPPPAPKEGA